MCSPLCRNIKRLVTVVLTLSLLNFATAADHRVAASESPRDPGSTPVDLDGARVADRQRQRDRPGVFRRQPGNRFRLEGLDGTVPLDLGTARNHDLLWIQQDSSAEGLVGIFNSEEIGRAHV